MKMEASITVEPNRVPVRHCWGQRDVGLDPSLTTLREDVVTDDGDIANERKSEKMYDDSDIETLN